MSWLECVEREGRPGARCVRDCFLAPGGRGLKSWAHTTVEERLEVGRTPQQGRRGMEREADLAAGARGGRFSKSWPGEERVA